MTKVIITESHLENIADALREKTGKPYATYQPWQMANEIAAIPGGASIGTASMTNSTATNTSIAFTGLSGQPIAFFCRETEQMTSSSTTYYYVTDMVYNGTTTEGNCFRMGSTRRVQDVTSGFSFTYSNGTLTLTSTGTRTSFPGSFYNGTYELVYIY